MAALLADTSTLATVLPDATEEEARAALRRASGAVRAYCGWNLLRETVTGWSEIPVNYGTTLYLPTMWLVSVEALTVDGLGLLDPSGYTVKREGRIILAPSFRTFGSVTVDYTHGYDLDSPQMDHIRGVVSGAAMRLVDNPTGRRHQQIGGEAWTLATGPMEDPNATLSSGEKAELDRYVIPRL